MLYALLPLLLCIAVFAGAAFVIKRSLAKSSRGPAEKEGMKKGILVAFLTDSWLLGWLYAKKKSEYDYDERRLK